MRTIDEQKLLDRVEREAGTVPKLRAWLRRQPRAPHLVSRQKAAEMLGVASPYVTRLHEQGRMPDPIEVDGGPPVYLKEEVAPLAKEMRADRKRRARKRAARERKES